MTDITERLRDPGNVRRKTNETLALMIKAADEIDRLRKALEKLACLGNGDRHGNSIGNDIARAALEASK